MEFKEVIQRRYSCKQYSGRQVEPEKLNAILAAGRLAPTAKNLQEQKVYVIHRIAADGSEKGIGRFCINWAFEKTSP